MAGKFMKIKKLIIPVLTAIILTSQLTGCASVPSNVMLEMLNQGQDIEITMAVPDYKTTSIGEFQALQDIQLDKLQTYAEFRGEFDTLFGIKPIQLTNFDSKSGCAYVNERGEQEGNTSFMDSLRNKVFMEKYLASAEVQTKLGALGAKAYIDIESDEAYSQTAALNAYYNLLNDSKQGEDEYFNATQSLSRGDYYSFIYRATNPVNSLLKTQGDFKNQVGVQSDNALYASQVDQYAWLNADNTGLRKGNYESSISRAEAVYMLMNMYFADELKAQDVSQITLSDAKDGGEMLDDSIPDKKVSDQLYSVDKKTKEETLAKGWQLGVISKMMKSGDGNVHTDIYKALGLAESLGIISSETRYNEPISKSEAIELLISVGEALNKRDGYTTEVALGDASLFIFTPDEVVIEVPVEEGVDWEEPPVPTVYNPAADLNKDGHVDKTEWEAWVKANPLDKNQDLVVSEDEKAPATSNKPTTPPSTSKPDNGSKPTTPPATSKPDNGGSKPTPPGGNGGSNNNGSSSQEDWDDMDDKLTNGDTGGSGGWEVPEDGIGGFKPVQ